MTTLTEYIAYAESIGAQFCLIVPGGKLPYVRLYKRGSWELSRNCLLYWNEEYARWDNSSELSTGNIEYGLRVTNRRYKLLDLINKTKTEG